MAWCGICLGYGKQKGAKIHSHIKCATVCIILMSLINHFYVGAKSKDGRANAVFLACFRRGRGQGERGCGNGHGVSHTLQLQLELKLKLVRRKVCYR